MALITLGSAQAALLPGMKEIKYRYPSVPMLLDSVYYKSTSDMQQEIVGQFAGLGMAMAKPDGAATMADGGEVGQLYLLTLKAKGYGLMYSVSRELLEDNLYPADFQLAHLDLVDSMRAYENVQAHAVFNNATTADATLGGDGQALASLTHPVRLSGGSGFAASYATTTAIPQSLSEASLLAAMQYIPANYVNNRGMYMSVHPKDLMISYSKYAVALRLLGAEGQPNVISNNPNVIPVMHGGVKNLIVSPYFTNPYAWYLTTDVKGFCEIQRTPFEISCFVDFKTDNLEIKTYARKGWFNTDPRGVWVQPATA